MIANHVAARLSALDLAMALAIPPGGNWRDIPTSIPSARLDQIRISYAAGEGSRSTYYGRLRADRPAYTINTYYNRPGNGCHLHYDISRNQHRTLSHREAARLQSFPDDFVFMGGQRAICQQIGNAVPPLLAYQVARALGEPGCAVDVFAGAGGLALGLEWAGWQTLAAVDLDKHAVETFNRNIAPVAFVGDMNEERVHQELVTAAGKLGGRRLALVGGPPCQGFSTGGKRRSPEDARNQLHKRYAALLKTLHPDVFVFENVLGLLTMDGGEFVNIVLEGLRECGYEVGLWRMNTAEYGVPQRRERVVIVGVPFGSHLPRQPQAWTVPAQGTVLVPTPTVFDALSDLPELAAGEDGSHLPYPHPPLTVYQRLLRGQMAPQEYVEGAPIDPDRQHSSLRPLAECA